MVRIKKVSDLEQHEMYMKSTKSELVKMLIQSNKYLSAFAKGWNLEDDNYWESYITTSSTND